MSAPAIELAPQQKAALDAIEKWWTSQPTPVFRLFGYAGTGKTTIAKLVPALLGVEGAVRFAAFTGKAAHVLARKGCAPVSTIHSLIYDPIEVIDPCALGETCPDRDAETGRCPHQRKRVEFERRAMLPTADGTEFGADIELLILDEVSMVGVDLARDLLSFGVPILVLGDPGQLPPIKGEGYFTDAAPDHMLTEVHRQASESPVLRAATLVRERGITGRTVRPSMADLQEIDQILVWRNRTRWSIVRTLRTAIGRPDGVPVPGDRIICIANNKGLSVFNGQQFWVTGSRPTPHGTFLLSCVDDQPMAYELETFGFGFVDQKGEEEAKRAGSRGNVMAATFANAITVHKAQGSEWPRVAVIDESWGMKRAADSRGEDGETQRRRWLYTAITRASDEVVLADAQGW